MVVVVGEFNSGKSRCGPGQLTRRTLRHQYTLTKASVPLTRLSTPQQRHQHTLTKASVHPNKGIGSTLKRHPCNVRIQLLLMSLLACAAVVESMGRRGNISACYQWMWPSSCATVCEASRQTRVCALACLHPYASAEWSIEQKGCPAQTARMINSLLLPYMVNLVLLHGMMRCLNAAHNCAA